MTKARSTRSREACALQLSWALLGMSLADCSKPTLEVPTSDAAVVGVIIPASAGRRDALQDAGEASKSDAHGEPQAALWRALARVQDPTTPPEVALLGGLRAMFGSDPAGPSGWSDLGDREGSPDLKVALSPATRRVVARPGTRSCAGRPRCRAVVVTAVASNVSAAPIHLALREEWHGGALPPSSLVVCVRPRGDAGAIVGSCAPSYLVEKSPSAASPRSDPQEIELAPGATTTFDVRLDWAGTGSVIGAPLVEPEAAGAYFAAAGLVFRSGGRARVSYSDLVTIVVSPP